MPDGMRGCCWAGWHSPPGVSLGCMVQLGGAAPVGQSYQEMNCAPCSSVHQHGAWLILSKVK